MLVLGLCTLVFLLLLYANYPIHSWYSLELPMQLPVSSSESELEERIIQHLAAAAAMGRARHFARRDGQRNRSSAQGRPQFLVFSTHPNGASAASPIAQREGSFPPAVMIAGPNSPFITVEDSEQLIPRISSAQADQHMTTGSGSNATVTTASSSNRYILSIILNVEGCDPPSVYILVGLQVVKTELDHQISSRSPRLSNPALVHCQQGTSSKLEMERERMFRKVM